MMDTLNEICQRNKRDYYYYYMMCRDRSDTFFRALIVIVSVTVSLRVALLMYETVKHNRKWWLR